MAKATKKSAVTNSVKKSTVAVAKKKTVTAVAKTKKAATKTTSEVTKAVTSIKASSKKATSATLSKKADATVVKKANANGVKKASNTTAKKTSTPTTKKTSTHAAKKATTVQSHLPVEHILITQPKPESDKSPYFDLERKYHVKLDFHPFIRVEGLNAKDFRKQKIDLANYGGIILLSRNAVDHFFRICDEMKFKVSQELRYFCATEAVALYLQKFIQYRKRKVFFSPDGSPEGLIDVLTKYKDREQMMMPVSENTKNDMSPLLNKHGFTFVEAVLYRTVSNDIKSLMSKQYDVIVFFSPFSIDAFMNNGPQAKQKSIRFAAFGNATCKAVEDAGLNLEIKAPTPNAPSMVAALNKFLLETEGSK